MQRCTGPRERANILRLHAFTAAIVRPVRWSADTCSVRPFDDVVNGLGCFRARAHWIFIALMITHRVASALHHGKLRHGRFVVKRK